MLGLEWSGTSLHHCYCRSTLSVHDRSAVHHSSVIAFRNNLLLDISCFEVSTWRLMKEQNLYPVLKANVGWSPHRGTVFEPSDPGFLALCITTSDFHFKVYGPHTIISSIAFMFCSPERCNLSGRLFLSCQHLRYTGCVLLCFRHPSFKAWESKRGSKPPSSHTMDALFSAEEENSTSTVQPIVLCPRSPSMARNPVQIRVYGRVLPPILGFPTQATAEIKGP